MAKRNRRVRTPRATQLVCERMLSKSAAKNAVSRKEMVFPSVQLNFCLPSQRSTRFQTGKDKIPGICRICAPSRGGFWREFSRISMRNRAGAVGRAKLWPPPRAWSIVLAALILRHGFSLRTPALVFAAAFSAPVCPSRSNTPRPRFGRLRFFRNCPRRHFVRQRLHRIHSKSFHWPRRFSRILFLIAGNAARSLFFGRRR